jgi:UDP-glucuronate 4-epimerase
MNNDRRIDRVLVTGAAGFIGSNLVERLLDEGYTVWGLDNFDPFYARSIKESNLEKARSYSRFGFSEGDLRDPEFLEGLFDEAGPEAVIHLAARAGVRPSLSQPEEYYDVNVMGTLRLLEAMRGSGANLMIFGSSSSVYGARSDRRPFREDEAADSPVSPYAATKRAGELLCHAYHHLYGISCCCLRFFTVYGPRQRPDLAIHKFTSLLITGQPITVYGDGAAPRDYTYVDDTVDGVVRTLHRMEDEASAAFDIINLGAGRSVSVNELVNLLAAAVGVEPEIEHLPVQPGDVPRTWADITRARELLGFDPKVSIEKGLERFVAWYSERHAET